MDNRLKNDPRLKKMDPQKLALLSQFAEELARAPQAAKMNLFLTLNRRASKEGLTFSPEETDLLLTVLTESLSPEDKKRAELIRTLLSRPAAKGSAVYRP